MVAAPGVPSGSADSSKVASWRRRGTHVPGGARRVDWTTWGKHERCLEFGVTTRRLPCAAEKKICQSHPPVRREKDARHFRRTSVTIAINGQTYATIQEAVDAAVSGDIVLVSAGTFREQVTVSGKDITIQGAGAGQTIIESPDAAALVANASDSNTSRPTKYAVVTVKGDADATIIGVTVDGRDQGSIQAPPTNYDFMGIYVLNSDAHVDGVAVTGADELAGSDVSGVQRNHAILVTSKVNPHDHLMDLSDCLTDTQVSVFKTLLARVPMVLFSHGIVNQWEKRTPVCLRT